MEYIVRRAFVVCFLVFTFNKIQPFYSLTGADIIDTERPGMGPIFLQSLECMEGDTELLQCFRTSPLGFHNCDHSQDVSVSCKGTEVDSNI